MKMKLAVCFCCLFVLLCGARASGQNANMEKAIELWEKVIAAKGGRENLYAIKNLVVSKKSYSPFEDKEFQNSKSEKLFVMSGKLWSWIDERPGFSIGISQYDFENEIGYEITENSEKARIYKPLKSQGLSKGQLSIVLDGERYNNFAKERFLVDQLIYLMETKWFQPQINGMRSERIKGENLNVVEVSFGRQKLEYFIDSKTNLPNKIRRLVWFEDTKEFDNEDILFLEDYIEVAGVKFPQVIRRSKKTETKTTYKVNVKYKENLFNKPPSIADGQEGWKPKQ
jgi:hypothetical protein